MLLYILYPEKFEKIVIHVSWILSRFSGELERRAVGREVSYMVSSEFARNYRIEEVPRVVAEWGRKIGPCWTWKGTSS